MNINTNIPGWHDPQTLRKVAYYASQVPVDGHILELGALFGRTTYALGFNKHTSVKLTTIDWWITYHLADFTINGMHDGLCGKDEPSYIHSRLSTAPDRIEGDDFYDIWKKFTAGINNHDHIRSSTQLLNSDFPMVDFIYHDAGHSYTDVYNDLTLWFPKLKHDGIIILDDYYRSQFPGLCDAVDVFVKENTLYTEMITNRNILLRRQ